jgi:carbon monoxide dehydrogenase subunit G
MKIKNKFRVPLAVRQAWQVLNDVPRVARCVPGAELVEERPDGSYVGVVRVKLGPVALSFRGMLTYKERDEANHRVIADASGNEERARGTAHAVVTFVLLPDGDGTLVDVDTDVQLAGSIAQYGRGAALIQSTAQVLMDEFARNFAAEFGSDQASEGAAISESASSGPASSASAPKTKSVSGFTLMLKSVAALVRSWFGSAERRA